MEGRVIRLFFLLLLSDAGVRFVEFGVYLGA